MLEGKAVRLEPLEAGHVEALCAVGLDGAIWDWHAFPILTREQMAAYVEAALAGRARGTALPFVTIERVGGTIAGCTRFGNVDPFNRRVEIGWTWLAPAWWRTGLNLEAKLLMLGHAFDAWQCARVEFKTDARNARSRAAIEGLGARFEGTLRHHMVTHTDRMRDTVYYSILAGEWPAIRAALEGRLARRR